MNYLTLILILLLALVSAAGCYLLIWDADSIGGEGAVALLKDSLESVTCPEARARLAEEILPRGHELDQDFGHWLGDRRETLRPLWSLLALNATTANAALPFGFSLVFTAGAFGLLRREKTKTDFAFASTTQGYFAKILIAISIAAYLILAFVPVGLPVWLLYVFILTTGAGVYLYLANVPPKF